MCRGSTIDEVHSLYRSLRNDERSLEFACLRCCLSHLGGGTAEHPRPEIRVYHG